MRPSSGEILAMLGSVDFFNPEIDGQVNVALRLRQPGSAIKPVTYVAAFEKGWTPATLIMDVPIEFPDGYKPTNYDEKFRGPVLLREALGSSYNVPAVKTLQYVGLQHPSRKNIAIRGPASLPGNGPSPGHQLPQPP
jgi:membrane carboxypeptidase/penicillin-binding protein PbpC